MTFLHKSTIKFECSACSTGATKIIHCYYSKKNWTNICVEILKILPGCRVSRQDNDLKKLKIPSVVFCLLSLYVYMLISLKRESFYLWVGWIQTGKTKCYVCNPTSYSAGTKEIGLYLLLESTSYSYWMLSLDKIINFLSHSNKRGEH